MRKIDEKLLAWATNMILQALVKGARKGRSGWQHPRKCSQRLLVHMAKEHIMRGPSQYLDAAVLLLMAAFRHDHGIEEPK